MSNHRILQIVVCNLHVSQAIQMDRRVGQYILGTLQTGGAIEEFGFGEIPGVKLLVIVFSQPGRGPLVERVRREIIAQFFPYLITSIII